MISLGSRADNRGRGRLPGLLNGRETRPYEEASPSRIAEGGKLIYKASAIASAIPGSRENPPPIPTAKGPFHPEGFPLNDPTFPPVVIPTTGELQVPGSPPLVRLGSALTVPPHG